MLRVAAIIPWRPGHPARHRHHQHVRTHLQHLLPDAIHLDADSGHPAFSRAATRNHGVHLAEHHTADVVVLCDADTLPEQDPLLAAIAAAADGRLHLPYTRFRGLSAHGTTQLYAGKPAEDCDAELDHEWSTGGVLVIQPDAWWAAGGQDERFTGWGMEDTAYRICADAILGPTAKHPGTITHLWHPTEIRPASPQYLANAALHAQYRAAEGNPDAVRALLQDRTPAS